VSTIDARDELPENRKVRLFLQLGTYPEYRCIAWFELRRRDFYWGPSMAGPDIESIPFDGTSVTISAPDNLVEFPLATWKASRHESGVLHVNATGQNKTGMRDVYVGPVTEITQPTLFAALLDKQPQYYPPYKRSLTRDRAAAIVIRVPEESRKLRHYFEIFLTPAGTFTAPPTVISLRQATLQPPIVQSLDTELDVILAIRHFIFGLESSKWHPEIGIWMNFHPLLKA
jgi:hypothetical protein